MSYQTDFFRGQRIEITRHILNSPENTWLKPSDLAAFIIVHRHYSKLNSTPEVQIEIPPWVEDHYDARLNYIKNLARAIEEKQNG